MHSLIDIMGESQKRYTMVEPKATGTIAISGSNGSTELFNIKGSGVVKCLSILTNTNCETGIKIEIDGKTIYDSFIGIGYLSGSGFYLMFGDKNNLKLFYHTSVKHCYLQHCSNFYYYNYILLDETKIFPFDTSSDNIATLPNSDHLSAHAVFLSDGGIEFKESFVVSAKRRDSPSKGYVYAGIEYMMS